MTNGAGGGGLHGKKRVKEGAAKKGKAKSATALKRSKLLPASLAKNKSS